MRAREGPLSFVGVALSLAATHWDTKVRLRLCWLPHLTYQAASNTQ
jgi:hypothetical protein